MADDVKESKRRYRQLHSEEIRQKAREYYEANKAKILAKQRKRLADPAALAKRKEYERQYRQTHRKELAAKARRLRAANPQRYRQRDREYYAAHLEEMAAKREKWRGYQEEYRKRYYEFNKEKINERIAQYRAEHGRPHMIRDYLDSGEASVMLGITINTLYAWETAGKVTPIRTAGGHRRYRREEIENLSVKELQTMNGFIVPSGFDLIKSYDELTQYTEAFADREIGFLLLVGSPGSGKSKQMQHDIKGKGCVWIDNHAATLGLYCKVYAADSAPVVLDDVNHFFKDKIALSLMKALTQTDDVKHVSWESTTKQLVEKGVPTEFNTRSPICMIANTWDAMNADFIAVQDRAMCVAFFPSAHSIHSRVIELGWCQDKEVVKFVEKHLDLIEQPSMRDYYMGAKYKKLGMDWKQKLLRLWGLTGLVDGPLIPVPKARPVTATLCKPPKEPKKHFKASGRKKRRVPSFPPIENLELLRMPGAARKKAPRKRK